MEMAKPTWQWQIMFQPQSQSSLMMAMVHLPQRQIIRLDQVQHQLPSEMSMEMVKPTWQWQILIQIQSQSSLMMAMVHLIRQRQITQPD